MMDKNAMKIAKIQLWCSIIQSSAIFVTFAFLTIQTINANKALEQTNKALRSNSTSKISDFMTDMNLLLISDEELQQLFPWEKSDLLAFVFINNFNEWYYNRHEGLIKDDDWKNAKNIIHMTSDLPWVKKILQNYYCKYDQLHKDYRLFLKNNKIIDETGEIINE